MTHTIHKEHTTNIPVLDNLYRDFCGMIHLQFMEHWNEFSMEPEFSFDELSSVFSSGTVKLFSYLPPVPTAVKEANGRLRMVDPVLVRAPLRKQVRIASLKSGFRKAYISGFTNELVAMVKKETINRA